MRRQLFAAVVCTSVALTLALLLVEGQAPAADAEGRPLDRADGRDPQPGRDPWVDSADDLPADPEPDPEAPRLDDYRWKNRVLILFAPSAEDEDDRDQKRFFEEHRDGLKERELVLIEVLDQGPSRAEGKFMANADAEALRRRFKVPVDRYALILVGKDGTEKARWYTSIPAPAIFGVIDAMPMRKREMREQGREPQAEPEPSHKG